MKLPTFQNPLKLFTPAFAGSIPATSGSQGGNMMFSSSGSDGGGSGGGFDDDYGYDDDFDFQGENPEKEPANRAPQSNRTRRSASGGGNDKGGRGRSGSHQPEERYWTDYLRIALPVIGIILMLGLLWVWASSLLGGDSADVDATPDTVGMVTTQTVDPNAVNTEPIGTPAPQSGTNAGEIPISGQPGSTNPPYDPSATEKPSSGGDNQGGDTTASTETPASEDIAVDSEVELTEDVNVRPSAGVSGDPIRIAVAGETATVLSGPEDADDYTWWELLFTDGSSGFVVEEFLKLVP